MTTKLSRLVCVLVAGLAASDAGAQSDQPKPTPSAWNAAPSMRHARAAHAVAATDDLIIAMAGIDDHAVPVMEVEQFDGRTWTDISRLPAEGLNAPAAVALDARVYLIGGFGTVTNVPVTSVRIFDPKSNQWSSAANLPTPRGGHAAAVLNNQIHVIGGGNSRSTLADHAVYDPATDRWIDLAPLPHAEGSPAAVVCNAKLYAIGGRSGPQDFGDVFVYDANADKWTPAPSIDPRATCGAVAVRHSIYLVGGERQSTTSVLSDVLCLADAASAWQPAVAMPTARSFARAVLFKGAVHVVGGSAEPQTSHAPRGVSTVERLELAPS